MRIDDVYSWLEDIFGLSPYEARAYVALVTYGPLTPKGLAERSDVPYARTYDILRSLEKKGFAKHREDTNEYAPIDPEVALRNRLDFFEEQYIKRRERAEEVMPKLLAFLGERFRAKPMPPEKRFWIGSGSESVSSIAREILRSSKKKFAMMISSDVLGYLMVDRLIETKEISGKESIARVLLHERVSARFIDTFRKEGIEVRVMKGAEGNLVLGDDSVLIIAMDPTTGDVSGVEIREQAARTMAERFFEEEWERAKG